VARSWMEYRTPAWVQWCPGCGNFGILAAIQRAISELDIEPKKLTVVSGIGCSGRSCYYIKGSNMHVLHGRAIPVATGIKLANPSQTVIALGGDGDMLGIGVEHFVSVGRRNIDITVIVHDNAVYGLTKGQAGPTLPAWIQTKALPGPNLHDNINPVLLAFASGYTFIARGYAYHVEQTKELIKQAIEHKGTSLVQILQPCPTYNNIMTKQWYEERIYYLNEEEPDWDPVVSTHDEYIAKMPRILMKLVEWGDKIPLGVLYRNIAKDTFEERLSKIILNYYEYPPGRRPIEVDGKPLIDPWIVFKERVVETQKI